MSDPRTLQLLRQARHGDPAALDDLYDRERGRLRRLLALRASRTLLAETDLDDLVQEAYLEAHRRIDTYSYQGRDSFFRWLATIAIHRMQNLGRTAGAEKRRKSREVRLGSADTVAVRGGVADVESRGAGPKTLAVGNDEAEQLSTAICRLSDDHREVVLLARVEGLKISEVAERIGRSPNATALLLSRALRKLKAELSRMQQPPANEETPGTPGTPGTPETRP